MRYNQPDRKAPRYRRTRVTILNYKFYKAFRKKFPQYKDLKNSEIGNIISKFHELLWTEAATTRDGVEFPEGMGYCFVGSCPSPKKINVDPKKSYEHGVIIRHRNFESDNFLAKICYTNYASKYKFQHRELWKFIATRPFKQLASESYRKNWRIYLQLDNFVRISKAILKVKLRDYAIKQTLEKSKDYNEFALD
jgi:hypothetical protein